MMIWAFTILSNKLRLSTAKCGNFELKCIKMRLAAGLCPDPLGKLERSRPPSRDGEANRL